MFNTKNLLMTIILFLLVAFPVFLDFRLAHTETADVQASSNFKIPWDVFDAAGSSASSNSFKLQASVGQSLAIGKLESDSYRIYAGFQVPSVPTPPPKPGDVSDNGKVTAYDASMVLQHVVGLITLSPKQQQAADVTGDKTVSALDAALILQYTVGLIIEFPVQSELAAPALNPELETKLLTEAIKQLDTTHLTKEQKEVLEQLKRLISQELPPTHTMLFQNFPNPFNPETWIPFQISADAPVTIRIYTAKGQLVRVLNLGTRKAGTNLTKNRAAYWDGKNSLGQPVASGVYFYNLQAGEFRATRKMVIVK
ncbi:T9SS type A sorting domain-containing protein [bacterium]|nr:T9SS type A sorting domain-containing protein [bacterium]